MSSLVDRKDPAADPLSPATIFLMAAACAFAVATLYYNQPLLPEMGASFGRSGSDAGLLATATQLGYAGGLVLFVPLGDRIDRKRLILTLLAFNMASLLAVAFAPTFAALIAASVAVGLTAVMAQVIIPAISGLAAPEVRGRIVGSLLSGLSAGLLFARTLSGVVGGHAGWRTMFLVAVGIDAVLMAIVIFRLPRTPPSTTLPYLSLLSSLGDLIRREPVLRAACLAGFLMFAAFSALWGSLATLLAEEPYRFGPDMAGAFGFVGLAGLLASPWIGRAVDRLGAPLVLRIGALTVLLAFLLVIEAGSHIGFLIAAMILLDIGNRAGLIANQSRIYTLAAEARSRLNTVFMSSYFLGGATGAGVAAHLAQRFGWYGLAATGIAFALCASMMALAAKHPGA
ncbi:putative MFS family arabinose efflux permease [Brevundimonas sp. SORGH_AS 993]|nr:putative MFS family arabinose efflux permease [Brevundimonas sp. SORGH_AS_0993]